jgi:DNA-directed RNA polymerase alpha subunit
VQKNPQELLKYRNFGKKSLAEIEELLKSMGLELGKSPTAEAAPQTESAA